MQWLVERKKNQKRKKNIDRKTNYQIYLREKKIKELFYKSKLLTRKKKQTKKNNCHETWMRCALFHEYKTTTNKSQYKFAELNYISHHLMHIMSVYTFDRRSLSWSYSVSLHLNIIHNNLMKIDAQKHVTHIVHN